MGKHDANCDSHVDILCNVFLSCINLLKRWNMSVKKGKKQWTVEECSNLIEAYRQHPNLWNTSHVNYKNRLKKYCSLKEIAELFGTNYEEIERKLKNIISQYQRERRTYKKLKKSGFGHVFKPKWFGYASMCFLQQKNKPINDSQIGLDFEGSSSSSSEDSDANEGETCELDRNILDVQLKVEPLEQYTEEESESQKTEEISQIDTKERRTSSQPLYSAPNIVKKPSKLADSSNMSSISEDTFNMIKSVYQEAQRAELRDKYTIFGELVSHTIRNLKTNFSKATVEHLISNILYQAQIGAYDYPQHSSVPCSYTTPSSSHRVPSPHYTAETHTDNPTTVTSDI
ncbi:uncharacterized protein LOC115881632 isoform X2 [Sitophilus oryzae]|uniref:Uncharacterized protein LOC115881632 isoform X2 n=1 Tax=Sitophilus oryzae TaxID=7048 RepID=A0A6J2XWA7_SITOR|nr:uncharacterized protein LOC115881632 isoform X2 [Sitophilus oryzae]